MDVPNNIAYSEIPLTYHMDLSGWVESPPGVQILHCIMYVSFRKIKQQKNTTISALRYLFLSETGIADTLIIVIDSHYNHLITYS